jgi:hypothetical protein
MADQLMAGVGPLWGPDFLLLTVAGQDLQVYPDANNPYLKAAGLPTQYYLQPSRVYLAKKEGSNDYDFAFTLFKGLMTSDRDVAVTAGTSEVGGGWCTFSTTLGLPDDVLALALQSLATGNVSALPGRVQTYFNYAAGDPQPRLGVIPITESDVTINVPEGGAAAPVQITALGTGKGSIQASGFNSFLVNCNQAAAGAIGSALKAGMAPPFTISCDLKEQFYIQECSVKVTVDVDKAYTAVSSAVDFSDIGGIGNAQLNQAYSKMLTTGAVTTEITMSGGITDDLKKWIDQNADDMRKRVYDLVKSQIFDWDPSKGDAPATSKKGLVGSLFGGSDVALKINYSNSGLVLSDDLMLNGTIAVDNQVSGDLNDLMPAVVADPAKYFAVVDIGQFFEKIQVTATCAIEFGTPASNPVLRDPIRSAQIALSYPDFNNPLNPDGSPNLDVPNLGQRWHIGTQQGPPPALDALVWQDGNATDAISVGWLRLAAQAGDWVPSKVHMVQTLVYDGADPRVDLPANALVVTEASDLVDNYAPVVTAAAVGYVFVHFAVDRPLPTSNIEVTVTATIGGRTDTLVITKATQTNSLWEIYSDKYVDATEFSYSVRVEVTGPNFTDPPVVWTQSAPTVVPVPAGRIKYVNPCIVTIPPAPPGDLATVNAYIQAAM